MAVVTETFPGALPSINQKSDVQAVPSGQEDLWVNASDMNKLGQMVSALGRASQLQALLVGRTANGDVTDKVVRLLGTVSDAVADVSADFSDSPSDLNKAWAACIEKLEEGGDIDGTASGSAFFGVNCGIISGVGSFAANELYNLSSDGTLFTYAGGKFPPIAIGLATNYALFDSSRRTFADNSTLEYTASGSLQLKGGGTPVFGNTEINGTLTVSGVTTLSAALQVAGLATLSGGADINGTLSVSGVTTLSGLLNAAAGANIDGAVSFGGAVHLSSTLTAASAALFLSSVTMKQGLTVEGAIEADTSYKLGTVNEVTKSEITTTDATVTTLATIAIPDDTAIYITVDIVGRRTDAADRLAYRRRVLVYREAAGAATLEGAVDTPFSRESSVPLNATIDVSGNDARVRVTGQVGKTINWACTIEQNKVA